MNTDSGVPPIVLLVLVRDASREAYIAALEQAGFWIAQSESLSHAAADVIDLRPDIVIADLAAQEHEREWKALTIAVEASRAEKSIPLIVLEDETDAEVVRQTIERALAASHQRSPRPASVASESSGLERKTRTMLLDESQPGIPDAPSARACPDCERPLVWAQRSTLDGVEYDYYDWCTNGCGLYCFDLAAASWVKLA